MGVAQRLKESPSKPSGGGVASRLSAAKSVQTVQRLADPTLSVDALEQEKLQQIQQLPETTYRPEAPPIEPSKPGFLQTALDIINRPKQVGKAALDIVGRPSEIVAEYATPDAPLIGGPQDGMNARQAFLDRTGQRPAEGFVEKGFGMIAAPFAVPGASLGLGTELYRAAGPVAARIAARIKSPLGQNVAQEVLREGAVGGAMGVGQEYAQGSGDAKNAAISGAFGGALGAATGAIGPLIKGGLQAGVQSLKNTIARTEANQAQAIREVGRESLPSNVKRVGSQEPTQAVTPEPTNLDELVKSRGFPDATPENIAQTYNTKNWYHGTGTDKLTKDSLDPFVGSHESLFGQGVYLTDNPTIAEGYAKSRGKRGVPTTYESNVAVNRVLDLENPITPDVYAAIDKTVKPLDYQYETHIGEKDYFTNMIRTEADKGATPEQIITKLREEVKGLSKEAGIPTSEFVSDFQDLAVNLKQAGYDGLTHTGGARTGNDAHRVLILLDPQNAHGGTAGPKQVTRLDKYTPPQSVEPAKPVAIRVKEAQVAAASEPVNAAPMKQNWFTNLFGNQGVGISAFSSSKRISKGPLTTADQIVKNGIKTDAQGLKDTVAAQARATYQNFVDRLSPLEKVSGQTYETAMDANRSNNIANTIIRDKFVTPEGKVVGQSLESIFKKVARGQDKEFIDYLTLRHAKTRMERGERVYAENLQMTPERVQARLDMYDKRYKGFSDIAKEWDGFNDNLLRHYGVDGDLMTTELYKALREKNPFYAGMRRQFLRSEKPGRLSLAKTTSSSFSGQKAPIKEVSPTGSVRFIIDPRKTAIESVGAFVNAAMRNRVMISMVDAVIRNPEAYKGIVEIVQKPKSSTDLRQVLLEGGPDDFAESLNGDFLNLFKTTRVDGENIVRAMVKGQPVYLQVHDPEIVKTLIGMGPQASNVLIDVFSALSNATKRGATGVLAPVFAVKGATMDLVQSAIQARNPAQQAGYTVYAILSGVGDKLRIPGLKNLAEEYRLAGGEYSAALKGDRKLNTRISDMTRDPLLSPKAIGKGVVNVVKAPFKTLEAVGNIAENAPRMAAYKAEMQRLGGERTPENVRQAMSQAREITTNFSRKGALSRDIEAFVPYNNAAIQGTYRVMKGFKNHPIKTTAAVAVLGVLPKLYEYMQFHEDSDYQNLPARERSRFLIVHKNEDGSFTKIPMDPAYNSIGELTIEALRKYSDKDPNAFKGAADALANAWLPPAVTGAAQGITQGGGLDKSIAGAINSTVAAPFVATTSNQSFTGAPIVSRSVADRSPQNQYDERTSSIAKKLGVMTGMAPMKVDYLIRSYGGDPARLLLPLTSDVGQGNTRNTLLKNFIVDPAYTNTLTNDFYTGKEKLNQAYRDSQEVDAPLPSWYDDNLRKELNSAAKGSVTKQLSDLTDKKKAITEDKSISADLKATQLRNIQSQINQLYMDVNSRLQKTGILTR